MYCIDCCIEIFVGGGGCLFFDLCIKCYYIYLYIWIIGYVFVEI